MAGEISTATISDPNKKWGVCGFCAALGALHANKLLKTTVLEKHMKSRLLAEIKTYLRFLQADNSPLLKEIEGFTRGFKGYENFSVVRYIEKINSAPVDMTPDFSIAMPPKGVVDYLKRMHDMKSARIIPAKQKQDNVLLGFAKGKGVFGFLFGRDLKHWVYKKNDNLVYNWGEFKTLAEVKRDVDLPIGYQIAIF